MDDFKDMIDDKNPEKLAATAAITPLTPDNFIDILNNLSCDELKKGKKGIESFIETYQRKDHRTNHLRAKLDCRMAQENPIAVNIPRCSDLLLSLIDPERDPESKDDVVKFFIEYFSFDKHEVILPEGNKSFLTCINKTKSINWCLSPSCITLKGIRRLSNPSRTIDGNTDVRIRRLFIADLIWLFYFERMGIFQILGALMDDYAIQGKIPISNDGLHALILESMIQLTETGLASTVRTRDSSYRRCLGWTSDTGRKLNAEGRQKSKAEVNSGFNNLFHRFIQSSLEYYRDRRLAAAIQSQSQPGRPSVATLITIGDTINVLKKSFDPFDYGRNYAITLKGIIWVIAGLALIRNLRTSLGIPDKYDEPYEYVPAAYDILVLKKSITSSEGNRYVLHKECAEDARDILLDMAVLEADTQSFANPGGELENWLDLVENRIEGYRTSYRSLTGIDLGATPGATPRVEQQV
jgi:hypothetical protein